MKPLPTQTASPGASADLTEAVNDAMLTATRHAVTGPDSTAPGERDGSQATESNGSNGSSHHNGSNGNGAKHANGNGNGNGNGSSVIERNGTSTMVTVDELTERRDGRGQRGRRGDIASIRVSVVIPALNEALNLRHVLANLPDNVFEVILVPGSSTDDTEIVARTLRPDVRVIHQDRSGKGNALACGFAACHGDIIVTLDADGSADPKEIPAFVGALVAGADFAKGTRAIQGGGSHDMTLLRNLGNRGLTHLANVLHGTHYTDLCYGYNAFWHACLPALNVDIDGFEVETLLNLRAAKSGLRVAEVASFELARIHGRSNLRTFSDGWRVLGTILREWVPKHHRIAHTPPSRLQAGRRQSARREDRRSSSTTRK
jgi:hypothetical protein